MNQRKAFPNIYSSPVTGNVVMCLGIVMFIGFLSFA